MGLVVKDDGWRIPDWLWEQIEPLLPARPAHPLGCHNPRVPRPGRDERDLLRAPHRLPVERLERDRDLLLELGPPPLPGVA